MVKLFEAESNVDGFLGCDSVRFLWYCTDREKPAFPYEEVIMDYNMLGPEQKMIAEREIDKYVTETEIMELKEYLHRVYDLDLKARRIQLPMILSDDDDRLPVMPSGFCGMFSLYKDEGYNLSIHVVADYLLPEIFSRSHNQLHSIHRKSGEMFATALLKKLNVSTSTNLGKVVEEIYGETHLFVSKD